MADLSVCNRDKLWAKTSKAGLEFQLLVRNKMVHFCADGLVDTLKNIANKGMLMGKVLQPVSCDGFIVIRIMSR